MSSNKKQAGFGVVEVIIVVVIVAAIAVGGWYVWQKNQEATAPATQQATGTSETSDASQTPDSDTLTIAEWNIDAKNTSSYTLQYKVTSDKRYAYFTATELTAATGSEACGIGVVNGEQMGGARIARFTADEKLPEPADMTAKELAASYDKDPTLKDFYKQLGVYYYFYNPPQGICSEKEVDLQEKVFAAVKALVPTFTAKN